MEKINGASFAAITRFSGKPKTNMRKFMGRTKPVEGPVDYVLVPDDGTTVWENKIYDRSLEFGEGSISITSDRFYGPAASFGSIPANTDGSVELNAVRTRERELLFFGLTSDPAGGRNLPFREIDYMIWINNSSMYYGENATRGTNSWGDPESSDPNHRYTYDYDNTDNQLTITRTGETVTANYGENNTLTFDASSTSELHFRFGALRYGGVENCKIRYTSG
jgi:hypothetical protein